MFTFATDYYICVFIATIGTLQFACSVGGIRGLLIFESAPVARTLGLILVVAAFALFFGTGSRNINDYEGGLDAPTQGLFFFYGAASALVVTLVVSSLVNRWLKGPETSSHEGVDTLRHTNYALALARSIGYWRRNWRTQTKSYFLR